MSRVLCAIVLTVMCCVISSSTPINTTDNYKGNEITFKVNEDGSMTAIVLRE